MSILDKVRGLLAPKTQQRIDLQRIEVEKVKQARTLTSLVQASGLPPELIVAVLQNLRANGVTLENWPQRLAELKDIRDAAFAAKMPPFAVTAAGLGIGIAETRATLVKALADRSDAVGEIITAIPERSSMSSTSSSSEIYARRKG